MRLFRHIAALAAAYAVALQLLFGALAAAQAQGLVAAGWPPPEAYCATDETGAPVHKKDCTACVLQKAGGLPPSAPATIFICRISGRVAVDPLPSTLPAALPTPRLSRGPPVGA